MWLVLGSYLLANLLVSAYTARDLGVKYLALLPSAYALLHVGYGLGFLAGLFRFAGRWSDTLGIVPDLNGRPIYLSSPIRLHPSDVLKRAVDVAGAFLGLVFLSPFFLMIAVMIRRESPGPVFYRGPRTGRRGKAFGILKFRTMRDGPASSKDAMVTARDDPRITPLGKWLRDTKLNELPQLWNVLIGDMSLVGPRPERPEFVTTLAQQIPFCAVRHSVKPRAHRLGAGSLLVRRRHPPGIEEARVRPLLREEPHPRPRSPDPARDDPRRGAG
jgi:hypothetical protein